MNTSSKQRFLSIIAVLVILVTTLLTAAPVSAKNNGTYPYVVQNGDTIEKIAKRFGMPAEKILLANPEIKNPNILRTGQIVTIPAGRSEGALAGKPQRMFVWQLEKNGGRIEGKDQLYLVKNGDTVERIAKAYGITKEKLLEANPQIDDANKLFRGELVYIPNGRSENVPPFYVTPKDTSSK